MLDAINANDKEAASVGVSTRSLLCAFGEGLARVEIRLRKRVLRCVYCSLIGIQNPFLKFEQ
jgi:hypothetical protein